jgi:hypothetical protein
MMRASTITSSGSGLQCQDSLLDYCRKKINIVCAQQTRDSILVPKWVIFHSKMSTYTTLTKLFINIIVDCRHVLEAYHFC